MSLLRNLLGRRHSSEQEPWGVVGGRLVEAVLALLRAEARSLHADLHYGATVLRDIALLSVLVACLAFWAGAAVVAAMIFALRLVMPAWGAALLVGAVLSVAGLIAVSALRRAASRLESPATTVKRRLADHAQWWQEELKAVAHPDEVHRRSEPPDPSDTTGRPRG